MRRCAWVSTCSRTDAACGCAGAAATNWTGDPMARLRDRYRKDVVPHLMKERGYTNVNQVPRLEKIVLNMGLGEAIQNAKVMDSAVAEITAIAGQKPVVTKSRKAI